MTSLAQHKQYCNDSSCGCKLYDSRFETWSEQLPVNQNKQCPPAEQKSWLWYKTGPRLPFTWVCLVCGDTLNGSNSDGQRLWKMSIFRRHHHSRSHIRSAAAFLGKPVSAMSDGHDGSAPSIELFKELFQAFHGGKAPSAGYNLPSGKEAENKAGRFVWCLSEANAELKRRGIRNAETLNLSCDER